MFTKLDLSTNQKRTNIAYKIDTCSDRNLMPLRVFRILFPQSTMVELSTVINKSILLKMYNQSKMCSVKMRHNDKCVECRFFVMPGDGPALLGMPDVELFGIIRAMSDQIYNKTTDRKFDSKSGMQQKNQSCKANRHPQSQMQITQVVTKPTYPVILILVQTKLICQIIFHSSDHKEDKRLNKTIIKSRTHNEFNDLFCGIECTWKVHFLCK